MRSTSCSRRSIVFCSPDRRCLVTLVCFPRLLVDVNHPIDCTFFDCSGRCADVFRAVSRRARRASLVTHTSRLVSNVWNAKRFAQSCSFDDCFSIVCLRMRINSTQNTATVSCATTNLTKQRTTRKVAALSGARRRANRQRSARAPRTPNDVIFQHTSDSKSYVMVHRRRQLRCRC